MHMILCSALQAVVVRENGWMVLVWFCLAGGLVGWVRRISSVHMSITDERLSVFAGVVGWAEGAAVEGRKAGRTGQDRAGQPRS